MPREVKCLERLLLGKYALDLPAERRVTGFQLLRRANRVPGFLGFKFSIMSRLQRNGRQG